MPNNIKHSLVAFVLLFISYLYFYDVEKYDTSEALKIATSIQLVWLLVMAIILFLTFIMRDNET